MDALPRFVTLDTVLDVFAVSRPQAYALVRSRELAAIQVGGRGQWRVEVAQIAAFVRRRYLAGSPTAGDIELGGSVPDAMGPDEAGEDSDDVPQPGSVDGDPPPDDPAAPPSDG